MNLKDYIQYGIEKYRNDDIYSAIMIFKEILNDNPNEANVNYYLASSYTMIEGGAEFSLVYFQKAIELDEEKYEYYLDYAATLKYLGKYSEAMRLLEKVIIKFENIGNAYIMISSIYMTLGNHKKAQRFARIGNSYSRYRFDTNKKEWLGV